MPAPKIGSMGITFLCGVKVFSLWELRDFTAMPGREARPGIGSNE